MDPRALRNAEIESLHCLLFSIPCIFAIVLLPSYAYHRVTQRRLVLGITRFFSPDEISHRWFRLLRCKLTAPAARTCAYHFSLRISLLTIILPTLIVLFALPLLSTIGLSEPPILLLVAASLWIVVLTEVQMWSRAWAIPLLSLVLLWAVLLSVWGVNYHHQVRALSENRNLPRLPPKDITDIFAAWLNSRKDAPRYSSNQPYPVVLVAAEGGGIRSAYTTAMFLATIQQENPLFCRPVFAISGVSGGSVGAALYAALCGLLSDTEWTEKEAVPFMKVTDDVLSQNFLSAPLAALLGPEIIQRILPTNPFLKLDGTYSSLLTDRAMVMEQELETAFKNATKSRIFEREFTTSYDPTIDVPLLLFNATEATSGRRVVVAPVTISGDTDAVYLFRGTASVRIRFSTAAFLGARFPLISPAGEIAFSRKQNLALVDGGYVDNTGTETLAALIREIGKAKTVRPFSLVVLIPKSIEKKGRRASGGPRKL
jgi:Patatin-like phospholipase